VPTDAPSEVRAIAAELDRGMQHLRVSDGGRPYRAEVRLVRAQFTAISASYGGIVTDVQELQTSGIAEVRVGSYARDNTNYFGSDSGIAPLDVSLEPAPGFMRKQIWLGLDAAFRGATRGYAQKLAVLERLVTERDIRDYTPLAADPGQRVVVPVFAPVDRRSLTELVRTLSARFSEKPAMDDGEVHLQILQAHTSVVNTEGVVVQTMDHRAVLSVIARTRAGDGMDVEHGLALHFDAVPTVDERLAHASDALVERVLAELGDVARAPIIDEEYDGPLLFVGPAASQLLASTVAIAAAGDVPPLGDNGRLIDLRPPWQSRLGKTVMPPFIDLVDDPSQGFGAYSIDAEGVAASPIKLVQGGTLRALLMTRTPNEWTAGSLGRARMTPSLEVGPAISNLRLVSHRRGLSSSALENDLLARAREDGYEFAYVIELLRDGAVLGPVPRQSAIAYAGTGKGSLPLPVRVYRLEGGGKRTLVRGAILAPVSIRVLRRIRAVGAGEHTERMRIPVGSFGGFGSEVGIDGVLMQTVDVEVTSPSLLVEGMELLVDRGEHPKPPTLIHPLRRRADRGQANRKRDRRASRGNR
jgi:hypothetical protein